MDKFKSGDRIECCVKHNNIINPYDSDYEEIITFEIIGTSSEYSHYSDYSEVSGYFLFVPCYRIIKDSVTVTSLLAKQKGINKKFIGEQVVFIQENLISKVSSLLDGLFCCRCHDFYDMASPNQSDGTLLCWSCRKYPYR
jgi:hypothetical protein